MQLPPEIVLTVTNDLSYDQRMQRICTTLANAGYRVLLVGRQKPGSIPLEQKPFAQHRIPCRNNSGKRFYAEYNWRLYRFLKEYTRNRPSASLALCAIDLDTILPVLAVSKKRKLARVYDAHELFTEMFEVKRRKLVHAAWLQIEKYAVRQFSSGYTVNDFIAGEFERRYGVQYGVIRNMPRRKTGSAVATDLSSLHLPAGPFFLYQGAVNEGRCFETLIPAMKEVQLPLVIAGTGNFMEQAKAITTANHLEQKVIFTGMLTPEKLRALTPKAFAGITIFEETGMNQYYSLANRFFDYIQAGIPQVCVNYPEYAAITQKHPVALMINKTDSKTIAVALNKLAEDDVLYKSLQASCASAAQELSWENEETKLVNFWNKILPIK